MYLGDYDALPCCVALLLGQAYPTVPDSGSRMGSFGAGFPSASAAAPTGCCGG